MPRLFAAFCRLSGASRGPSEAKAVLQDAAKSVWNGMRPNDSCSALWNVRPFTVSVGAHSTGVSGVRPPSSRASVVTILNVLPGGA